MDWMDEFEVQEPDIEFITKRILNNRTFADWYRDNSFETLAQYVENTPMSDVLETIWALRMEITRQITQCIDHHEMLEDYETCALLKVKERELRVDALELEMKLESFVYYNKH